MKQILLPTDFSDNAWNALFTALKLYADVPCHFYLLNAHEPGIANLLGDKGKQRLAVIYDSMKEYSNQELNKVLDYLKKNHRNSKHTFEKISRTDDLVSAIQEILLKKDMDMIIMGTKGATGAKEVFMGSNTVKVIKAIRNRPVMAIPESYDFQILGKVIFPTDFTQFFEPFELSPLVELTLLWKAHIAVFQVALEFQLSDSQKMNKTLLDKRLADTNHSFHEVKMKEDITKGIQDFAKEKEAGMIALIHYGHTFLEKLTREPVVKKVAFHSKIPLLVLPELS
jgi:nucleotide-binding universal stress UspA family protein